MKYLFTIFIFLISIKINVAQDVGEPDYKIILKGLCLYGDISEDTFISVISKSYDDTLYVTSTSNKKNYKVLSFDITIAHKGKELVCYHSYDGVLKDEFYRQLKWSHKGDVFYIDNIYYMENGARKKTGRVTVKLI